MNVVLTVQEIAQLVQGSVEGDGAVEIDGVGSLQDARPRQISFVANAKRAGELAACQASAALVSEDAPPAAMTLIRVKNVHLALSALLSKFDPGDDLPAPGVHPTAVIAASAEVGADVRIGPGVVVGERTVIGKGCALCAGVKIGRDVTLGEQCVLFENVVVHWGSRLGHRVRVGPGCVIGYDGFGYNTVKGQHLRVPHVGYVELCDDVDLGANTCVDRAKFGITRVGPGTKIDNLVQFAHNVHTGRGCILAAQVGLAGSASLGDYVVMGGQVGVGDHVKFGEGAQIAAQSGVLRDVPAGAVMMGTLAVPLRDFMRQQVELSKLGDLLRRVKDLESRLKACESSEDH